MAVPNDNIVQNMENSYGTMPRKRNNFFNLFQSFWHGNLQPMIFCCLVPWALFTAVFGLLSFSFHYYHERLCWWIFVWCLLLTLAAISSTFKEFEQWRTQDILAVIQFPTWHVFLSSTMFLACLLGLIFGCCNFHSNVKPYLTIVNMRTYAGIDPSRTHGAQLMDAGQVSFTNNSVIDLGKSQGFKSGDTYCVAPIVLGGMERKLTSYDFWVVGINCCTSKEPSYQCGQYNNGRAHSGIRAVHMDGIFPGRSFLEADSKNEMFKMAIDQAKATHNLQVLTPLFFQWVEDPIAGTSQFHDRALKAYALGVLLFLAFQFFVVVMIYLFLHKR